MPSESQDGTHTITIQVEDGNGGSDSEAVTVTVSEVNEDPVLNHIGAKSVNKLEALTFTATASDVDVISGTADTLTFSLPSGPTGASITQSTGVILLDADGRSGGDAHRDGPGGGRRRRDRL